MSNIRTLSDKKSRKRTLAPERRVLLTIKNGVSMVQRDEEGNAIYRDVEGPKTKKRRLESFKSDPSSGSPPDRVDLDRSFKKLLDQAVSGSQLVPIAQLNNVEDRGNEWHVEWKDSTNERLTEALFTTTPWILVGHHDSQEAATVVRDVDVQAKRNEAGKWQGFAKIRKSACSLPLGKLKRAIVCAGPQSTSPENARKFARAFPKSSRSLPVSFSAFERLQELSKN